MKIISHIGNFENILKLSEVYHVPQLEANLISVSKLINHGASVIFGKIQCYIKIDGEIIAIQYASGSICHLGTANNYTRNDSQQKQKKNEEFGKHNSIGEEFAKESKNDREENNDLRNTGERIS